MFMEPIRHTKLKDMNDVDMFSFMTDNQTTPLVTCQNNGQIAYSDEHGTIYVTPYRSEIPSILKDAGYKEKEFKVPFSGNEKRPAIYFWLQKNCKRREPKRNLRNVPRDSTTQRHQTR